MIMRLLFSTVVVVVVFGACDNARTLTDDTLGVNDRDTAVSDDRLSGDDDSGSITDDSEQNTDVDDDSDHLENICVDNGQCAEDAYCLKEMGACGDIGSCVARPEDSSCEASWDPVCGCDAVTYDNDCYAAAAGVTIAGPGECDPLPCEVNTDCTENTYCNKPAGSCESEGACEPYPSGCDEEFEPVCGCDGKTYDNECLAHWLGINVARDGSCDAEVTSSVQYRYSSATGALTGYVKLRTDDLSRDYSTPEPPVKNSEFSIVFDVFFYDDGGDRVEVHFELPRTANIPHTVMLGEKNYVRFMEKDPQSDMFEVTGFLTGSLFISDYASEGFSGVKRLEFTGEEMGYLPN